VSGDIIKDDGKAAHAEIGGTLEKSKLAKSRALHYFSTSGAPTVGTNMSQNAPYRASILSLYKNILSLHRRKLPEQLRTFGDDYVRSEFKSMKKVKKAVFVEEYELVHHIYVPILCSSAIGNHTYTFCDACSCDAFFGFRFLKRWNEYAQTIRTQNDRFGVKMKKAAFERLDPEQQEQLRKLKSASVAAAAKAEGITIGGDSQELAGNDNTSSGSNRSPL